MTTAAVGFKLIFDLSVSSFTVAFNTIYFWLRVLYCLYGIRTFLLIYLRLIAGIQLLSVLSQDYPDCKTHRPMLQKQAAVANNMVCCDERGSGHHLRKKKQTGAKKQLHTENKWWHTSMTEEDQLPCLRITRKTLDDGWRHEKRCETVAYNYKWVLSRRAARSTGGSLSRLKSRIRITQW